MVGEGVSLRKRGELGDGGRGRKGGMRVGVLWIWTRGRLPTS